MTRPSVRHGAYSDCLGPCHLGAACRQLARLHSFFPGTLEGSVRNAFSGGSGPRMSGACVTGTLVPPN